MKLPPLFSFFFVVLMATALSSGTAAAFTVVIEHLDHTNPGTEGWATVGGAVGVTAGPVANDLGTGIDAWSVDDPTTAPNSVLFYEFTPTGSDLVDASTNGWSYEVTLRVVDTPENPDRATFADFISDATRWRMDFGSNSSGDPIVLLQTGVSGVDDIGTTFTLVGGGSGYHTYELRYDPALATADLYIDGIEYVSDYPGMSDTTAGPRITFGAGQATETGHGHFSLARFTIESAAVPSISARGMGVLVFALVVGGLFAIERRNQEPATTA